MTPTDQSTPERIWVKPDADNETDDWWYGRATNCDLHPAPGVAYVRAKRLAAMEAEIAQKDAQIVAMAKKISALYDADARAALTDDASAGEITRWRHTSDMAMVEDQDDPLDGVEDAEIAPQPAPTVQEATRDVLAERERQKTVEGWTPEHDDTHYMGEMARAAVAYVTENFGFWPWDSDWWKPKDKRRNLVRAAALLIAEIERLDRRALSESTSAKGDF